MKHLFITTFTLLCFILLPSCSSREATTQEKADFETLLKSNIKAYDTLNTTLAKSISTRSDRMVEESIAKYALSNNGDYASSLKNLEITKMSNDKAHITATVYKKATAHLDDDQEHTVNYKLVFSNGKWLISEQETIEVVDIVE